MLHNLKVNNFYSSTQIDSLHPDSFILRTCQRTLVITYKSQPDSSFSSETKIGIEAYQYLLEIICGLQSKLLAENEITAQFKSAHREYLQQKAKDPLIIKTVEKLFADSKRIRTNFLKGLSQKTYSAIARKELLKGDKIESVLILGSGKLAEDMINQLKKKVKVCISARNKEKVSQLKELHDIGHIEWSDNKKFLNYSHIVNTIGSEESILENNFFLDWKSKNSNRKFVDLGSPSSIKTHLTSEDKVIRLEEIFKKGIIHEELKKKQIDNAKDAIKDLAQKRLNTLRLKTNFIVEDRN